MLPSDKVSKGSVIADKCLLSKRLVARPHNP